MGPRGSFPDFSLTLLMGEELISVSEPVEESRKKRRMMADLKKKEEENALTEYLREDKRV